ncbi:hypothetical protein TB1_021231 [Malus domestica]
MSEPEGPNNEGSPSCSSKFEPAMSESSGPLLESCAKETLDDLHNRQTCITRFSPKASDERISEECRSRDVTVANVSG